ncbi:DUF421 domain-containing protein [Thermobifida fusca]|uniref:YetF C-terminal domain-containing protein n=2 Tax=Thermobifida fusca TaxID=2021 RepID=A0A9P2WQ99_THEFU|nr:MULTISPECIES: YetF domain-containing protein [Thermobifida]AAZ55685.1 conserved hypothetical membrane-anchored protein [Thermobifida fusca YX]EOR71297.1 hypothetical protein TM51_08536 [Thermobifida fusca TM51]MBO2529192.1 DUF421 domain-containing protein [Thermobifida sp.]MDD6792947.1 DUF421 domain-containing protein [Thermobifida fusca]PPS92331.1 membrane protein [Thermobifida fusca]
MDSVLRAVAIYVILVVVFRLAGKRSMAQLTTFDLLLLLVISEATQQALLGNDYSVTNAALAILTLVAVGRTADFLRWRFPWFARLTQSVPVVLVAQGKVLAEQLARNHIDESEILEVARSSQGISRMEQIDYAILEESGTISILPKRKAPTSPLGE